MFAFNVLMLSLCTGVVSSFLQVPAATVRKVSLYQPARYEAGDFFDEVSNTLGGDQDDTNENAGEPVRRKTDEELKELMGDWDPRVPKFNTVTLVGRIGSDPNPRYFDDGKVVLNLSLAVKRKYHPMERKEKNIKSGEEETDWFGLEIWGRDAEYASKYVDKGSRVGITGSLKVDQWLDKETQEPRERPKVVVQHLDILETKAESDMRRQNRRGPSFSTNDNDDDQNRRGPSFYTNDNDDDDSSPSSAGSGGFFD